MVRAMLKVRPWPLTSQHWASAGERFRRFSEAGKDEQAVGKCWEFPWVDFLHEVVFKRGRTNVHACMCEALMLTKVESRCFLFLHPFVSSQARGEHMLLLYWLLILIWELKEAEDKKVWTSSVSPSVSRFQAELSVYSLSYHRILWYHPLLLDCLTEEEARSQTCSQSTFLFLWDFVWCDSNRLHFRLHTIKLTLKGDVIF